MTLINIIGNYEGNNTGYGIHIRNYWNSLRVLENMNYSFNFVDYVVQSEMDGHIDRSKKYSGNCVNILICSGDRYDLLEPFRGIKILFTVFESTQLPIGWVGSLNKCDYVFTASDWGRDIMVSNGVVKKIFVIPEGVSPILFNPWGGKIRQLMERNTFRFLVVGKFEERKSYLEVFNAFRKKFERDLDVELYIKANSFVDPQANRELAIILKTLNMDNIKLIDGNLSDDILSGIYRSCHCFVFPSKAEGWGLPLIEAIASGMPTITTYYSGHTQFLSVCKDHIYEIPHTQQKITAKDYHRWGYKFEKEGLWAIPDIDSITKGMWEIYTNYGVWKERGLAASREIHKQFNWHNTAYLTLSVVNEIIQKESIPNV